MISEQTKHHITPATHDRVLARVKGAPKPEMMAYNIFHSPTRPEDELSCYALSKKPNP